MFNPEVLTLMLGWIGGVAGIVGFTEKIKWFYRHADERLKKILNYITSIVVSLAISGLFLYLTDLWTIKQMILYAIPLWLASSGVYDSLHTKKQENC